MIDLPPHQPVPHRPWWTPFASLLSILTGGLGITLMACLNLFLIGSFLQWMWFEPVDGAMVTVGLALAAYLASFGLYFGKPTATAAGWSAGLIASASFFGCVITDRHEVFLALVGLAFMQVTTLGFIRCLVKGARLSNDRHWYALHRAADVCPYCLYSTNGLTTQRCPECGADFTLPPATA